MQMGNTEKFILICSSQHILFFSNWDEVDKLFVDGIADNYNNIFWC